MGDQTEMDLPHIGIVNMEDPETGDVITVDTSDPFVRRHYRKKDAGALSTTCKKLKKGKSRCD